MKLLLPLLPLFLCACARTPEAPAVIPVPASVETAAGELYVGDAVAVPASAEWLTELSDRFVVADGSVLALRLTDDGTPENAEGYLLDIDSDGIEIASRGEAGLFYGAQTLTQLLRQYGDRLPAMRIADEPRFEYRGMHLDLSRHFFGRDFVEKQMRMMASLKLNRLHLHLTDGAGWRIEIDRYPLLTERAAWRKGDTWSEWREGGGLYCSRDDEGAYGGYLTKDDVRHIVALAERLHITVIPEIEMPGHSEEVTSVYPELGCTGVPYSSGDYCIGSEKTFEFLENVLTEVMELFPSEYIHIGGDEASKSAWRTCPRCRERMRREGLADVDELQSYAVRRIGRFLEARGRKLLGWDEIMEGGLAEGAAVMSWRGEEAGRRAAAAGHKVVMTPGGYCYFDAGQDNPAVVPPAMGSCLRCERVYGFDPAPAGTEGSDMIAGVQANLWTEYIPEPEHAEYMLYPRMFALAEVAWSAPERKDYADFRRRAIAMSEAAREAGYNVFDLAGEYGERHESLVEAEHLARGCRVEYAERWNDRYAAAGEKALVDGVRGSWRYDERWQGFLNVPVDVTIDLGGVRDIESVSADFMRCESAWIWLPERVEIEISTDGESFERLAEVAGGEPPQDGIAILSYSWSGDARARYVRYRAIPVDHAGGWLFTDEIIVE